MGSMAQLEYVIRWLNRRAPGSKRPRVPISPDMLEGYGSDTKAPRMRQCCGKLSRCVFSGSFEWVRL